MRTQEFWTNMENEPGNGKIILPGCMLEAVIQEVRSSDFPCEIEVLKIPGNFAQEPATQGPVNNPVIIGER